MGQRYRRAVTTGGGLSPPVEVCRDEDCDNDYATQTFTFAASALVTVYVAGGDAECQFYNGTVWLDSSDETCWGGNKMNSFASECEGIRLRNKGAAVSPVATITVSRYTT